MAHVTWNGPGIIVSYFSQQEIIQLRDLLQKTTAALDEARQKLDQRDDKIKMKDEEITRLQNEVANITGSYSRRKGTIV